MVAIFAALMVMFGALALAFAFGLFLKQRLFLARARFARGEVVKNVRRPSIEGGWLYRAVIHFETDAGQNVTFQDAAEASWIRHRSGESVTVLYEPSCPDEARINSFVSVWLPCLIVGIVGIFSIFAGGMLTVFSLLLQSAA